MIEKRKIKILSIVISIILYVFLIDPYLKFCSHLFLIKTCSLELYESGKYTDYPGGAGASLFFPDINALPGGCAIDFLYENPCLEEFNVWALTLYLRSGNRFERTFSLTLDFNQQSQYRDYKENLYEEFNLYDDHEIIHLSNDNADKLLHTVSLPDDYAGIYFDDENLLVKYVYFYLYDSGSDPFGCCTRRTTTFEYLFVPDVSNELYNEIDKAIGPGG